MPDKDDAAVLQRLMQARFSCRAYHPQRLVPQQTIECILEAARASASWCNVQPWDDLVIASGPSALDFGRALLEHARAHPAQHDSDIPFPTQYPGVYQDRRRQAGYRLYEALGIARDDHAQRAAQMLENFRLFGAPHVAIVSTPRALGAYGLLDAGGFVSAFMLAARAHGVDSTAQAALAMHSGFVRRWFGIPEDRNVVCGMAFGHADMEHPANRWRTARAAVPDLVRFV